MALYWIREHVDQLPYYVSVCLFQFNWRQTNAPKFNVEASHIHIQQPIITPMLSNQSPYTPRKHLTPLLSTMSSYLCLFLSAPYDSQVRSLPEKKSFQGFHPCIAVACNTKKAMQSSATVSIPFQLNSHFNCKCPCILLIHSLSPLRDLSG